MLHARTTTLAFFWGYSTHVFEYHYGRIFGRDVVLPELECACKSEISHFSNFVVISHLFILLVGVGGG